MSNELDLTIARVVGLRLGASARHVGLDGAAYGAHSLWSGSLTSAARKGASIFKMCDVSCHRGGATSVTPTFSGITRELACSDGRHNGLDQGQGRDRSLAVTSLSPEEKQQGNQDQRQGAEHSPRYGQ